MSDKEKFLSTDHNVKQWRMDTPGCVHRNHLNNAGAALMPAPVVDTVRDYLEKEACYGGYELADSSAKEISTVYEAIGQLIGAQSSNIAVVENATVAVSQALSAFAFQKGDTIITTNVVYSSNQIMLLNLVNRFGIKIVRAEDLAEGGVDPDSVQSLIKKHHPRLVLMSWIPTNSGLIQDAQAVGKICKETGIPFVLDACQAVGQIPVDVTELYCDFLGATSRKFLRGPRGLGFLYVSDQILEKDMLPMFPDTRGAKWTNTDEFQMEPNAKRFENWERPHALLLGLGAAANYAQSIGIETISKRALELGEYTRQKLSEIDRVRVLDRGRDKCAIVTAAIEGIDASKLVGELRAKKINTSAIMRYHGVIDMDAKNVETALRISPHYYNTVEEIDELVNTL